jgi:hypothetical protein
VVQVSRRVGAWLVAAVVTVALVAGGVLVARGGAERSPAVLPALDLAATGAVGATGQAGSAAGSAGAGAAATEPAPAPGTPAPGKGVRPPEPADRFPPRPPVTYRLAGPLPTLPDRARAWKVSDAVDPGRVAALAAALGLGGTPSKGPTGWTVRDGRRTLVVQRLAGVPFSYGSGGFGTCVGLAGGPYRRGIQCATADAPPIRPRPRPALPSPAEAERVARDLAARAGLDLAGATVKVRDGYAARTVTIAPAVGGRPTSGFAWTVTVGAKGAVQSAAGFLATPEPADTYPLIGVAEGFERLKRAPWPRLLVPLDQSVASAVGRIPCPALRVPCATRPLPARVVTVTGVRLGLQRAPVLAGGNRPSLDYLLPAYLFDLEGGWTDVRAVIAVPDRYLTR